MNILAKAVRSLPWDGQGLSSVDDKTLAELRSWAAREFWQRVPVWSRFALIPLSKFAWIVAAIYWVRRFGWSCELLVDCLRSGARPHEAWIWRHFFADQGVHPLGGRALGVLLSRLGNPAQHRILSDKVLTSQLLRKAGIPVPVEFDASAEDTWRTPRALFVKPRFGSAGRGTMAVDVLANGTYRINGGENVSERALKQRFSLIEGDFVVQERLEAAIELAELATNGLPPVLRLTVIREPGGDPFLHSALISIDIPGERRHNFVRGQMRAVVADTGRMSEALWFAEPGKLYRSLPWNFAEIAGKAIPRYGDVIEEVRRATRLFPDLPIVNWDLIATPRGPVILEGNTCGDWILSNLSLASNPKAPTLSRLLRNWKTKTQRS